MSLTDPVADMITRIRNGQMARLAYVSSPSSKLRVGILEVLKREGFIKDFSVGTNEKGFEQIKIDLKYVNGSGAIKIIEKVSKPGRRIYSSIGKLKSFYNGLGIVILSTPKGVMCDHQARQENLGGEVLCKVF